MVKFVVSMLLGVVPMGGDMPKKVEREPMFAVVNEYRNDIPSQLKFNSVRKREVCKMLFFNIFFTFLE